MLYLSDTNVLLRLADRAHPIHPVARSAVRKLRSAGHALRATTQNFVEFWNAATRPPTRNGFGFTPVVAERRLRLVERLFPLLPDDPAIYPEWRRLVVAFGVSGAPVYDARLVAAMRVHGLTHILTWNTTDFARYAPLGIMAVDPGTV
ncbi:MAG TPA: type II toxin-antitoxin system VapC family toxin [Gemmataceae bacterium]|nr:type II toxin-antitoxin system VapC family toxin [Gemmataceae bacterium]